MSQPALILGKLRNLIWSHLASPLPASGVVWGQSSAGRNTVLIILDGYPAPPPSGAALWIFADFQESGHP